MLIRILNVEQTDENFPLTVQMFKNMFFLFDRIKDGPNVNFSVAYSLLYINNGFHGLLQVTLYDKMSIKISVWYPPDTLSSTVFNDDFDF